MVAWADRDSSSAQSETPGTSGSEPESVIEDRPTPHVPAMGPLYPDDWYAPVSRVEESEDRTGPGEMDQEDPEVYILALNLPGNRWASPSETPRNDAPLRHFLGDTYVLVWGPYTSVRVLKELYNSHVYLNAPSERVDPEEWYSRLPLGIRELEEMHDEHPHSNLRKAPRGVRMIRARDLWGEGKAAEMWLAAVRTPGAHLNLDREPLLGTPHGPRELATATAWKVLNQLQRHCIKSLRQFGGMTLPRAGWRGITPTLLDTFGTRFRLPSVEVLPFPDRDRQIISLSFLTRSGIRLETRYDGNEVEAEGLRSYWEDNVHLQRVGNPGTLQLTLEGNGHDSLPKAGAVLRDLLRERQDSGRMLAMFGTHDLRKQFAPAPSPSLPHDTLPFSCGMQARTPQTTARTRASASPSARPPSSFPSYAQILRRPGKEPEGSGELPASAQTKLPPMTGVDEAVPDSPAVRAGRDVTIREPNP